jgi:hypothetical protein
VHTELFFGGWGWNDPEAIYNLFYFKNYVKKIMSKSPSQHLGMLQGKLNEKERKISPYP